MDLFAAETIAKINEGPLAARMRPRNLDEYIGQDHIVGKGRLLRRAIAADQLTSVIFYGPPGTGKTTLARVIANHTKSNFITLNAVLTGVQNIRDAISQAENHRKLYGTKTILFVDEVHRWNKSQQDALLPWVENGTFILVGATTENPFFEVNKALVSRSRVFQLKPLTSQDLKNAAINAIKDQERGYGKWNVVFEENALEHLIDTANGDARSLLNALELAVETTPDVWPPELNSTIYISKETAEESIQKKVVLYDRDGDYHYDIISAFIKSLRGRDPDAAMYWLARMVRSGEDPHFIFRRMLISACEDTGLADPFALGVVESCAAAFDRVGLPEGRYHLAHAALYLATAPKSNSSMAFFDALSAVEKEDAEVPNHLRDANRDSEGFGHGAGYMYPHAYRDHWVAQQYLPDTLAGRVFYTPTNQGYEGTIKADVLSRREMQIAAMTEKYFDAPDAIGGIPDCHNFGTKQTDENLTFSPGGKQRDAFQKRLDRNRGEILLEMRNKTIEMANLKRHHRNLIFNADDGLFLWEIWRNCPEGITCGICNSEKGRDVLNQYGNTLQELDKTVLATSLENIEDFFAKDGGIAFDNFFFRDAIMTKSGIASFVKNLNEIWTKYLAPKGQCVLAQKIPTETQRLGNLLIKSCQNEDDIELLKLMLCAEDKFYKGQSGDTNIDEIFSWTSEDLWKELKNSDFTWNSKTEVFGENRRINQRDIDKWFNEEASTYAKFICKEIGSENFIRLRKIFEMQGLNRTFIWQNKITLVTISKN